EIDRGQEPRIGQREDEPDDAERDDDRQVAEIALPEASARAQPEAFQPRRVENEARIHRHFGSWLHGGAAPLKASRTSAEVAPVMAATTSTSLVPAASKLATRRPRRSTTIRSATENTSTRLSLITTTPRS